MNKNNVIDLSSAETIADPLTELLKSGARKLIEVAVQSELNEFLNQFQSRTLSDGRSAVVRNGYHPERELQTGIGSVTVKVPKVRTRDDRPVSFHSALVPPYIRKTRSIEATIPWLYLKGISSGEMQNALKSLLGPKAAGLSASTLSRMKQTWQEEYEKFRHKDLNKERWVYIWADGIYSGLRSEDSKLCVLVIIGVNEQGKKHFLAIEDGVRESTQSWREVLLNLKSRGMNCPRAAIGDGAMGFWAALDEVFPKARHQRCWMHKTGNVLNKLPKASQPKAKKALHDIWQAETKAHAEQAFDLFIKTYEPKFPKATTCLQKDHEQLLTFYALVAHSADGLFCFI